MDTDAQIAHFLLSERAWIRRTIDTRGWALQAVFADPDQHRTPFCYSIGLTGLGHPELVVFGLPPDVAGAMLNTVADRIAAGAALAEGQRLTFRQWPHRVAVLPVPNPWDVLLAAYDYYRPQDRPLPAFQLVWDDRHGRFPWEPDYEPPQWLQPLPGTFSATAGGPA